MPRQTLAEIQQMIAEAKAILASSPDAPPPLSLRPVNVAFLTVGEQKIPQVLAEFLSQLDEPQLRSNLHGVLLWQTFMDIPAMNGSGRPVDELEGMYLGPVKQAGAAIIDLPAHKRLIMYPRSIALMRELFFEVGFGQDDYINPIDGKPLSKELNTVKRVKERLDQALPLFDQITSEQAMTLTRITTTGAQLETLDGPPPKKWAEEWAQRMWDYYVKYKSEATFAPGFIPGDSLTLKEFRRQARKFGRFMLGGY